MLRKSFINLRRRILSGSWLLAVFFAAPAPAVTPWSLNINMSNVVTVTNMPYGGSGNGTTDNTLAISNAIVVAAAGGTTNGSLGGIVRIPGPGIYLTGPLLLKNNVGIHIDAGAILRMQPISVYTNLPSYGGQTYGNLFFANGLSNMQITGPGAIDGQGSPWWSSSGAVFSGRPYAIYLSGGCSRVLIQNLTISNTPAQNIVFKGKGVNITVSNLTEFEPDSTLFTNPSHNTDGVDLVGTNILVMNCNISVGDDNLALGTSSSGTPTAFVTVTNCAFGTGHGVSIGSNTQGGVSNLLVIDCTFNGTGTGIRMKSDTNSSGGSGQGGITQNLSYLNLGMTNVSFPVLIYSYYSEVGTPSSITPAFAAAQPVESVTANTPLWSNITISNLTVIGGANCVIWSRTELPATNILFSHVNIATSKPFEIYNATAVRFADSQITVPPGNTTFQLFNAQVTITNSAPTNTLFTFDGLTTNGFGNVLSFYNAFGALKNTNVLDDGPLTLAAGTLTVSNNLALFTNTLLNFTLGTNTTQVAVVGNLALGGTNTISAGPGFTNSTYALLTYTGTLSGGVPQLGSAPVGYNYAYDTSIPGLVNLVVSLPVPPAPTNLVATATNLLINLKWNAVGGAVSYNLKRGTANNGPYPTVFSVTATNYADAAVSNAVNYFYVVTAVNPGGESTNSAQVSAVPLPSNQPTNIVMQLVGNQMQLSWPQDHLGWRLQIQTNNLSTGISANWTTVANSTNVNAATVFTSRTNGAVFLRLVYP